MTAAEARLQAGDDAATRSPPAGRPRPTWCAPAPTPSSRPARPGCGCARTGSTAWPPSSPRRCSDDEACPVCGSAEHPRPAAPAADAVTREQEAAAGAAVRAAEQERGAAQQALAALDADLAAATAAAGGDEPVELLRAARDEADGTARSLRGWPPRPRPDDVQALAAFGEEHESWLRDRVALDEEARALRKQAGDDREPARRPAHRAGRRPRRRPVDRGPRAAAGGGSPTTSRPSAGRSRPPSGSTARSPAALQRAEQAAADARHRLARAGAARPLRRRGPRPAGRRAAPARGRAGRGPRAARRAGARGGRSARRCPTSPRLRAGLRDIEQARDAAVAALATLDGAGRRAGPAGRRCSTGWPRTGCRSPSGTTRSTGWPGWPRARAPTTGCG